MEAKRNRLIGRKINTLFVFAVLSFCLLLIYSPTTSPLAVDVYPAGDSTIFQVIGRYWVDGKIPYIDLWDLKGPYIFLMNAIGYFLTGDKTGVFIVQTIHLFSVFCIIWQYSRLVLDKRLAVPVMAAVILYYLMNFDSGNMTEEYCMPWMLLSIMLQYRWVVSVKDGNYQHSPKNAFIYGVCFSVCLLTRVTNAIGVCMGILVIAGCLIANKEFRNLLRNACAFLAGVMIVVLPFVIYYARFDGVKELAYGTVLYNIGYYQASGFHFEPGSLRSLVMYLGGYFAVITALLTMSFSKRKLEGLLCLVVTATPYIFLMTCNGYRHYNMILTPGLLLAILELYSLFREKEQIRKTKFLSIIYVAGMILVGTVYSIHVSIIFIRRINNRSVANDYWGKAQYDLVSMIPKEEKTAFIAYDCDPGLYITENIPPCYRFFTLQEWEISQNPSLKPLIVDEFQKREAEWILTDDGEHCIDSIVRGYYELFAQQNDVSGKTYYLFQRK